MQRIFVCLSPLNDFEKIPLHKPTKDTYSEELLGSGDDVSDNDCSAERVDDVLVVGVEDQTVVHLAYNDSTLVIK